MAFGEFFIEIETRCNARCFFCDTGNKSRAPKQHSIDLDLFEKILDHAIAIGAVDHDTLVNLFDRGEPTLHPQFEAIVTALNTRELPFAISTNCGKEVFISSDTSLELLEKFIISVPGFSQASYDRIHKLPFDKVLHNIDAMLANFRARGFRGEPVMSLHVYRFNEHELAPAAEFCEQRGILFSPYYAFFADYKMSMAFATGALSGVALGRAEQDLCTEKLRDQLEEAPRSFRCPQWDRMTINERGELVLCCGAPRLGDVYDDGFVVGPFLSLKLAEIIKLKTTASVCGKCIASGVAYANHSVIRPEFDRRESPQFDSVIKKVAAGILHNQPFSVEAENGELVCEGGDAVLIESAGHGCHRIMGWWDIGEATSYVTFKFDAKAMRRPRLKLEMRQEASDIYGFAILDLAHGHVIDQRGAIENVSIERSSGGEYFTISIIAPVDRVSRVHYMLAAIKRDGSYHFPGAENAGSFAVRDFCIDSGGVMVTSSVYAPQAVVEDRAFPQD